MANIGNFQNLAGSSTNKTLAAFAQKMAQIKGASNETDANISQNAPSIEKSPINQASSSVKVSSVNIANSAEAIGVTNSETPPIADGRPIRKGMLLDIRV